MGRSAIIRRVPAPGDGRQVNATIMQAARTAFVSDNIALTGLDCARSKGRTAIGRMAVPKSITGADIC